MNFAGRRRAWLLGSLFIVAGAGSPAAAQSLYTREENTPVTSRSHPEFDALGVHVGAFTAYPRISIGGTYDDNVYALPEKTSGFIVSATPSVEFVSNWARNAFDMKLQYERDQYVSQSSESSDEYSLSSTGRLDIDRSSAITMTFDVARLTEPRTSPDSLAAFAEPVRYDLLTTGLAGYREFNRLRLDVELNNQLYSFFDVPIVGGGLYPESSRDEDNTSERVRLSWALGPNIALFGQATPNQSRFFNHPFNGFTSYDSDGYEVLGGVNAQITHLMTIDAGVGYLSQTYDDPRIPTVTGTAFDLNLRYFPTQLLTVTAHASHNIAASGLPGTPASDVNSASVNADYELRRNIILSPGVSYAKYEYPGTTRADDRYGAHLNATYLINRTLGLTASYAYIKQDSNGGYGGYKFDDNRLSLTLTIQR